MSESHSGRPGAFSRPPPSSPPTLTFFCELEPVPLEALFETPGLLPQLRSLGASISLGLLDLSAERAAVVRKLNAAGVPVTAWLLLPREDGYFLHVGSVAAAAARFDAFRAWIAREGLHFRGIGLDVELDRRELDRCVRAPWWILPAAIARATNGAKHRRGIDEGTALIGRIRAAGHRVEAYQFPAIADDRASGSTLLQRLFGMMDLPVDREVWMLYSSILPPRGPAWLMAYGPEAEAIAVGSTGGGIDSLPKLSWEALRRDLLLAHRFSEALSVFSLEGCVAQGFLPRIAALDWSRAQTPAHSMETRLLAGVRALTQKGLALSAAIERWGARRRERRQRLS